MRLTRYTDYALRVLTYLGAQPDRVCSVAEIARAYGISQNHLMKVAHDLGKAGYIEGVRGRTGGIRLSKPADRINVGAVVRRMEDGFALVECDACAIAPACDLTRILDEAMAAFMAVLDRYTLADLLKRQTKLLRLLGVG